MKGFEGIAALKAGVLRLTHFKLVIALVPNDYLPVGIVTKADESTRLQLMRQDLLRNVVFRITPNTQGYFQLLVVFMVQIVCNDVEGVAPGSPNAINKAHHPLQRRFADAPFALCINGLG